MKYIAGMNFDEEGYFFHGRDKCQVTEVTYASVDLKQEQSMSWKEFNAQGMPKKIVSETVEDVL